MAIVKTEAYFNSSTGRNKIHTLIWHEADLTPVGVFQIAHGMAEHIERYDDFARFLASNGFVVCGNDHLGHGKSVNSDEDYGYFDEYNGDKRLVDDMHILTKIMKKKYPDLPYFLFGHSMGSLCARVYTAHFGEELNGVIYCGTAELPAAADILQPVFAAACEKFGAKADAHVLGNLFNAAGNLAAGEKNASPVAWISRNKQNQENYMNDPLCGFPLTLGGYRDMYALACECASKDWAYKIPADLPVMIFSGAKDPVGFKRQGHAFRGGQFGACRARADGDFVSRRPSRSLVRGRLRNRLQRCPFVVAFRLFGLIFIFGEFCGKNNCNFGN